jgi:hypothetical protein
MAYLDDPNILVGWPKLQFGLHWYRSPGPHPNIGCGSPVLDVVISPLRQDMHADGNHHPEANRDRQIHRQV